jgi:uncharacterized protein
VKTFTQHDPLINAELARLGAFLESCKGGKAMNIEQLDGFFAALIAGPRPVVPNEYLPNEYLPEVFGGDIDGTAVFEDVEQAKEILGLMNRHWNTIAATLYRDEIYVPLVLKDENGIAHGNDWARGFMRGTSIRPQDWVELLNDEKHKMWTIPMMTLWHEHLTKSADISGRISPKDRVQVIGGMAAGLLRIYQYFRERRNAYANTAPVPESRRGSAEVGGNDPCPCGSGKKYKRCCGGAAVN